MLRELRPDLPAAIRVLKDTYKEVVVVGEIKWVFLVGVSTPTYLHLYLYTCKTQSY